MSFAALHKPPETMLVRSTEFVLLSFELRSWPKLKAHLLQAASNCSHPADINPHPDNIGSSSQDNQNYLNHLFGFM